MAKLSKKKISENLNKVVDLLRQADALLQKTLEHNDELYYIHTQIENAADDVIDVLANEIDPQIV
jgi:hypothetical protein